MVPLPLLLIVLLASVAAAIFAVRWVIELPLAPLDRPQSAVATESFDFDDQRSAADASGASGQPRPRSLLLPALLVLFLNVGNAIGAFVLKQPSDLPIDAVRGQLYGGLVVSTALGCVFGVAALLCGLPPKPQPPRTGRAIAFGIASGLAAVGPSLFLGMISSAFGADAEHSLIRLLRLSGTAELWALVALTAVIAAPLLEELEFRVIAQTELSRRAGLAIGITATVLLFAVVHGPAVGVSVLPLGIAAALVWSRTHSYLAAVAAHATFNLTMLMLLATTVAFGPDTAGAGLG